MNWCYESLAVSLVAVACSFGASGQIVAQEEIRLGGRRIVGGEQTDIQSHPWQIAINIRRTDGIYLCGGTVAQTWILSAAHCFRSSDQPAAVRIKAGATNYVDEGIWSDVERVVMHERYNSATYEHDIAMLKVKRATSGRVIPLIPTSLAIPLRQPLEVTGWGTTTEGGQISKRLLKGVVPYVANTICNEAVSYNGRVLVGMLCAGHSDGGTNSCQGDSGGPLVWNTEAGNVLVGVVSFGDGCARRMKYGVYTRVSSYLEWIARVQSADQN